MSFFQEFGKMPVAGENFFCHACEWNHHKDNARIDQKNTWSSAKWNFSLDMSELPLHLTHDNSKLSATTHVPANYPVEKVCCKGLCCISCDVVTIEDLVVDQIFSSMIYWENSRRNYIFQHRINVKDNISDFLVL